MIRKLINSYRAYDHSREFTNIGSRVVQPPVYGV